MRGFLKVGKNGHHAKAIAFGKSSVWLKKIKVLKTWKKQLYDHINIVPSQKRVEKTANIREMRGFWKLAKMATMERLWPFQNCQFGSKNKIA